MTRLILSVKVSFITLKIEFSVMTVGLIVIGTFGSLIKIGS